MNLLAFYLQLKIFFFNSLLCKKKSPFLYYSAFTIFFSRPFALKDQSTKKSREFISQFIKFEFIGNISINTRPSCF